MALVTSKEMLTKARKGGYAVGAFNAENMEMVKAIIAAAEELKAPVMIQTTPSTVKYGTSATYAAIVKAEAEKASVPVCMHLDHGSSYELAEECIGNGYTSVMIDGSKEDFENNIAVSKKVVEMAHAKGIPVEAELGKVGGKEETRKFLENLGFVTGGEVTVVSEIEGNLIVNVKDSRVAVGKDMAAKILI